MAVKLKIKSTLHIIVTKKNEFDKIETNLINSFWDIMSFSNEFGDEIFIKIKHKLNDNQLERLSDILGKKIKNLTDYILIELRENK